MELNILFLPPNYFVLYLSLLYNSFGPLIKFRLSLNENADVATIK